MLKHLVLSAFVVGSFAVPAFACDTVDANLNVQVQCVNVGDAFYQVALDRYDNQADATGYYWQLGTIAAVTDNGACATVDSGLNVNLPCVSVGGTEYDVTLNRYDNAADSTGYYWQLGTVAAATSGSSFSLTSQCFTNNGAISSYNACTYLGGSNMSPQLSWQSSPGGTASYALIVDDEDSPCGTGDNACKHWAVYNIPSSVTSLDSGQSQDMSVISGVAEGTNYTGVTGYVGPCPPNAHTYKFTIYALSSSMPTISAGTSLTRSEFASNYGAYILGSATLQGVYTP